MEGEKLKVVVEFDSNGEESTGSLSDGECSSSSREGDVSSEAGSPVASNAKSSEPVTVHRPFSLPNIKKYENKAVGEFVAGFDPTSKEFKEKQELRAKRFGEQLPQAITEEAVKKLYESLGVDMAVIECGEHDNKRSGLRFDTIHVHGVNNMSTSDVFNYFVEFAPTAIEWIDDASCNVTWLSDKAGPVRALLKLSQAAEDVEVDKQNVPQKADEADIGPSATSSHPETMQTAILDDDELNLLNDDDVAKLGLLTVTAEQNKIALTSRRSGLLNATPAEDENRDERVIEKMDYTDSDSQSDREIEVDKRRSRAKQQRGNLQADAVVTKESDAEAQSDGIPWPPGKWRLGVPCQKAKWLFMRFASTADKKLPGAGRRSEYYRKHGNPNFGGMKGLISRSRAEKMTRDRLRKFEKPNKTTADDLWAEEVVDETEFDRHLGEISAKRQKLPLKNRRPPSPEIESSELSSGSEDELDNSQILDDNQLYRLNEPKRSMRMYADDVEQGKQSAMTRLGASRRTSQRDDEVPRSRREVVVPAEDSLPRRQYVENEKPGDIWSRLAQRESDDDGEGDHRKTVVVRHESLEDRPGNIWSRLALRDNVADKRVAETKTGDVWTRISQRRRGDEHDHRGNTPERDEVRDEVTEHGRNSARQRLGRSNDAVWNRLGHRSENSDFRGKDSREQDGVRDRLESGETRHRGSHGVMGKTSAENRTVDRYDRKRKHRSSNRDRR